jgi:hypothetical protein
MKVITIMPDYGGYYAWLKQQDDGTTLVGGGIGNAGWGFEPGEFWVSPGLEQAFADWMDIWGGNCDDSGADWPAFHGRGIELAHRLKEQVGDQVRVIYHKAWEDPAHIMTERTEILPDGGLKQISVRAWSEPKGAG